MSAGRRDQARKAGIFAASALGHIVVFALIGLNVPEVREKVFDEEDAIMVVDLFRPPPPPRAARPDARRSPTPAPSQVRPREVIAPRALPVLPLPMAPVPRPPAAPPPAPATGAGSGGAGPGPGAAQPGGDLRGALRGSTVGCANRAAVGLNRREREACDERFGAGAADAPFIPAPMGRAKRESFDAVVARKERDRRWRESQMPVGTSNEGAGVGMPAGLGGTEEGTWRPH